MTAPWEIRYDPHARFQMEVRGITEAQVAQVLISYHTSYPAEPLPGRAYSSVVYIGTVAGRDLKVYVREHSSPPYVTTVVWRGD